MAYHNALNSLDCRVTPVITSFEQAERIKRTHHWCSRSTCHQVITALAFIKAMGDEDGLDARWDAQSA